MNRNGIETCDDRQMNRNVIQMVSKNQFIINTFNIDGQVNVI